MANKTFSLQLRFQLLVKWLTENYSPRRTADIGGGNGLLAYLLNQQGWDATVIDPEDQQLYKTYMVADSGKRLRVPKKAKVKRINLPFEEDMAKDYDLLVGLYSHGANIKIINASVKYGKDFVLFPCHIINEPITIEDDIDWIDYLEEYTRHKGLKTKEIILNFATLNYGFYTQRPVKYQAPIPTEDLWHRPVL